MVKFVWKRARGALCGALAAAALCGGALADDMLIPVGAAVGIQMKTDGVMVVDVAQVRTADGESCPAGDAGLLPGDVIVMVGSRATPTAEALMQALDALSEGRTSVTVKRGGRTVCFPVTPARDADGALRLGLWLRDGLAGVGTLTYIDPATGRYGALGHGVCDADTGVLLPLSGGTLCRARIVDVKTGLSGEPGALCGSFDAGDVVGAIDANTACGIFGAVSGACGGTPLPAAQDADIRNGPARILSNIAGDTVASYDVQIARTAHSGGRSLLVQVTDPALLAATGGIVQGMSGSPIIQNGMLVGAVTHVLVDDPARGYGVTIQTMLAAADALEPAA